MAWWCFQQVVVTAALAGAVALVCRLGRFGPVSRHALWLVVLVKFVTPPIVPWPWAMPDPLRVGSPLVAEDTTARAATSLVDGTGAGVTRTPGRGAAGYRDLTSAAATWPASFGAWIAIAWVGGGLVVLLVEGTRIVRLRRRVRSAGPADRTLNARVRTWSHRLGLAPVEVRIVPGHSTPCVWALGRPQLLWPDEFPKDLSDASLDGLIVHELAHLKRRDHWIGWLELAAGAIWWWNPLYWRVRAEVREQAELACDAWVISTVPDGRRAYAESLLVFSSLVPRTASPTPVLGVSSVGRRLLERRLIMIMQGCTPLKLTRRGGAALALAAIVTLPGWATAQTPPPPPPTPMAVPATPTPPPPPPAVPQTDRVASRSRYEVAAQTTPPPATPKTAAPTPQVKPVLPTRFARIKMVELPADGQKLVDGFATDREAIQREADAKIAARQQDLVKTLEALQESYAKAGKLDEAIAIRDYLQSGLAKGVVYRKIR